MNVELLDSTDGTKFIYKVTLTREDMETVVKQMPAISLWVCVNAEKPAH